jgi:hypothetical protein
MQRNRFPHLTDNFIEANWMLPLWCLHIFNLEIMPASADGCTVHYSILTVPFAYLKNHQCTGCVYTVVSMYGVQTTPYIHKLEQAQNPRGDVRCWECIPYIFCWSWLNIAVSICDPNPVRRVIVRYYIFLRSFLCILLIDRIKNISQHGHGNASWTWTRNLDMDMFGHGDAAAWEWTHSMGIDKQHDMDKDMDMDC